MRHLIAAIATLTLAACGTNSTDEPAPLEYSPPLVYDCATITEDAITYNDGTVIEGYTDEQYWEAVQAEC